MAPSVYPSKARKEVNGRGSCPIRERGEAWADRSAFRMLARDDLRYVVPPSAGCPDKKLSGRPINLVQLNLAVDGRKARS